MLVFSFDGQVACVLTVRGGVWVPDLNLATALVVIPDLKGTFKSYA